jgi:hypothetical protein
MMQSRKDVAMATDRMSPALRNQILQEAQNHPNQSSIHPERNSAPTGASETVNEMNLNRDEPLGDATCYASSLFVVARLTWTKRKHGKLPNVDSIESLLIEYKVGGVKSCSVSARISDR